MRNSEYISLFDRSSDLISRLDPSQRSVLDGAGGLHDEVVELADNIAEFLADRSTEYADRDWDDVEIELYGDLDSGFNRSMQHLDYGGARWGNRK